MTLIASPKTLAERIVNAVYDELSAHVSPEQLDAAFRAGVIRDLIALDLIGVVQRELDAEKASCDAIIEESVENTQRLADVLTPKPDEP